MLKRGTTAVLLSGADAGRRAACMLACAAACATSWGSTGQQAAAGEAQTGRGGGRAPAPAERPAQPDRLHLLLQGGARLAGPPARIDIRHGPAGGAPAVEISLAASDPQGTTWSVLVAAPAGFVQRLALQARISDGPLQPGLASVQRTQASGGLASAPGGTLQLAVRNGRLAGHATARGLGDLRFEGPYTVSCSVPAGDGPLAPAAASAAPIATSAAPAASQQAWVLDERSASALCQPFAALGRGP